MKTNIKLSALVSTLMISMPMANASGIVKFQGKELVTKKDVDARMKELKIDSMQGEQVYMQVLIQLAEEKLMAKQISDAKLTSDPEFQRMAKLNAEEFGVPQKRKRVVIVGTLKKEKINQPKSLFSSTNENLPKPITVKQAIGSLPELKTGEGEFEMTCNYKPVSTYEKLMSNEIDFTKFYESCLEKLPVAFG